VELGLRRLVLIALITFILAAPAAANPIYIPPAKPPLLPLIIVLDYSVDLFFILVVLALLRWAPNLSLRGILAVGALAMIGGFVADGVGGMLTDRLLKSFGHTLFAPGLDLIADTREVDLWSFLGRVLLPVPLIFLVNYALGRRFLGLSRSRAGILGIVVGICTTPLLYAALEQFGVEWLGRAFGLYQVGGASPLLATFTPAVFAVGAILFGVGDVVLLDRMKASTARGVSWLVVPAALAVGLFGFFYASRLHEVRRPLSQLDQCRENLSMIGFAMLMYEDDYGGYPLTLDAVDPYYMSVRPRDVRHCPADPRPVRVLSYTYRKPPKGIRDPGEFPVVRCGYHPHPTQALYLYADGHVASGPK
jgi:prepilin-type processing-associated H-X9-DG protein